MKKKIILAILSVTMILGCVGCGQVSPKEKTSFGIQKEKEDKDEKEDSKEETSEEDQDKSDQEESNKDSEEKEMSEEDQQVNTLFDEAMAEKRLELTENELALLESYQAPEVTKNTLEGGWNRTNCLNGYYGCMVVYMNEGELEFSGEYTSWAASGCVDPDFTKGYLISENRAIFIDTELFEEDGYGAVYFLEEKDGHLEIAQAGNGCGFGMGVDAQGEYTKYKPRYTNENIMNETFDEAMQERIKTLLEENDIEVESYFVTPVTHGVLDVVEDTTVVFADGSEKTGTWYDGIIPHDGYYYFSMFISDDDYIYYTTALSDPVFASDDTSVDAMPEKK